MSNILNQLKDKYDKLGLSRKELAKELNLSLATLDRMLANNDKLPTYKKIGRQYIFPLTGIAAFFEEQQSNRLAEEEKKG